MSGDFATTANFALVVSGVPTSGEKTNASGASGASGSTPGGASRCMSQAPSPAPPMQARSTCSGSSSALGVAAADVHDERLAEVAAGSGEPPLPSRPRGSSPCHRSGGRTAPRGVRVLTRHRPEAVLAQRRAQAGAELEARLGPSASRAGWMPRIEDASSSSSAAAIRSSDRRSSRAGCSASTRARTVPGSWRPSSGGVTRCVPSTMKTFA